MNGKEEQLTRMIETKDEQIMSLRNCIELLNDFTNDFFEEYCDPDIRVMPKTLNKLRDAIKIFTSAGLRICNGEFTMEGKYE